MSLPDRWEDETFKDKWIDAEQLYKLINKEMDEATVPKKKDAYFRVMELMKEIAQPEMALQYVLSDEKDMLVFFADDPETRDLLLEQETKKLPMTVLFQFYVQVPVTPTYELDEEVEYNLWLVYDTLTYPRNPLGINRHKKWLRDNMVNPRKEIQVGDVVLANKFYLLVDVIDDEPKWERINLT